MVFASDEDMEYLGARFDNHLSCIDSKKRRNRARKRLLVKMKGGICEVCGGAFPDCVFDFHHPIASEKVAGIAAMLQGATDEKFSEDVIPEAMKCSLLCSNCHRVIHFGGGYSDIE